MLLIESIDEIKNIRKNLTTKSIGLVPTMGNLHHGHQSLIARSVKDNDITILSIFINPSQFNNQNDLANYPKTLEQDLQLAKAEKVDYVFMPKVEDIYHDEFNFRVSEHSSLSQELEGQFRPGHFTGMLTIVLKLLLLAMPTKSYFGEKDYQQLQLVKSLVKAFFLDTEIIACPTIRRPDGLPLSSRNNRLSENQLKQSAIFSELLASDASDEEVTTQLKKMGFKVDYINSRDNRRLGAIWVENVRLIDNCSLCQRNKLAN
jgi:pantoate--beta-alanine ligase